MDEGRGDRSEALNELFAALAKAQADIKGAKKDSENPHFRAKYADLASVREACHEALVKNGLAVIQRPFSNGTGEIGVETVLGHSSGQWISSRVAVKPIKADAQGAGAVITYLRRFGLAAMVGVAPLEDDDGETAVGRGQAPAVQRRQAPPPRPQPAKPPTVRIVATDIAPLPTQKNPPPSANGESGGQEIPFDEDTGEVKVDPAVAWIPPSEVTAALENRNLGPWLRWFLSVIKDLDQEAGIRFGDLYLNEIKLVKNSGGRNWAALSGALEKVNFYI